MKYSLHHSIRSFIRELIRGHFFRYYYYMKIKNNEFSREKLEAYISYRFKKLVKAKQLENKNFKKISDMILSFPIISKIDVKKNPKQYESNHYGKIFFNYAKTSGTTGTPLQIKQSLEHVQLQEAFSYRQRKIAGYSLFGKVGWIRGDIVVASEQLEAPFWCRDYFLNRLMMSSYHISNDTCPLYIQELENFDPILIEAYPSSIFALAMYLKSVDKTFQGKSLKGIITSSEVLTEDMRKVIEERFLTRVFDWYGQTENVAAVETCEKGNRHLLLDYSFVELDSNEKKQEVIGTSYNNLAMPLIRYATGDFIEMSSESCSCGRIFPVVKNIYGRQNKPITLSNGRKIVFLDHIFKNISDLIEAQIVIRPEDNFIVNIVVGVNFDLKSKEQIIKNLIDRVGNVSVEINICEHIPRGKNGKFEFLKVENE